MSVRATLHHDPTSIEISRTDAGIDARQGEAGVELDDVFGRRRRDLGHAPERAAAFLLHLQADELEGVVRALLRLRQAGELDLDRRSALYLAVEPDHRPAARALGLQDARRSPADEQRRADREAVRVIACVLD